MDEAFDAHIKAPASLADHRGNGLVIHATHQKGCACRWARALALRGLGSIKNWIVALCPKPHTVWHRLAEAKQVVRYFTGLQVPV